MLPFKTLGELIISRCDEIYKGITFILDETNENYISYKDLYLKSLQLLYQLQRAGFNRGDEIIFQLEDNAKFLYSFWACILGGMIPVPVTSGANDEHKLKLFKIWKILNNPRIISTADFFEKIEFYAGKNDLFEQMRVIKEKAFYFDDINQTDGFGEVYDSKPDDIAFIQFSSGSTGDPKGVIITHSNVIINLSSVIKWDNINTSDVGLNWMPLTHDMGLIGTHIKGLIANISQFNMQTQLFIRHPSLWIQKASQHKVTILYSPNFGYKHFLKFYNEENRKEWDLSNIRLIYNGAEPISIDICNEFLDKMAEYGLKRSAMHPVYGLAEGTIAVTFPKPSEEFLYYILDRNHFNIGDTVVETYKEDKNSVSFLDVGYPIYNCQVHICDDCNKDLGEDKIGYVRIRGGNVTYGYYNNKAATEKSISSDGWLNTGDLGFLRGGRLVITGRAKDVIFAGGQNYYSHDIERVAEDAEGIELGKVAATGVFNEKLKCDELIMFVLFKPKVENFISTAVALKKVINERIGIEVSEVIPIKSIPKTTSGKVQRYKLRESYINGEFQSILQKLHTLMSDEFGKREIALPQSSNEKKLAEIWSEILSIERLGINDNFFELGGDSLKVTQLLSRIRSTIGIEMEYSDIFEYPTIKKLAMNIESAKNKNCKSDKIEVIFDENKKMPLSFAQKRIWFLDCLNGKSQQYNLHTALSFKGELNIEAMENSFRSIIGRHRILQASFVEENGQPLQVIHTNQEFNLDFIDLSGFNENERKNMAMELASEEAGQCFNLQNPPLLRGKLVKINSDEHMLILVAHHIVFDGWSFEILLRELSKYYEAFLNNVEKNLPELDIQYMDFANWQKEKVQKGILQNQLNYWKKKLGGKLTALDLPTDKQRPAVQTYNGKRFISWIPGDLVRELKNHARKENATLFMVLLAAFKVLLYKYTGQTDILVGSPIANRNIKDIEKLIGFFTNNIVLRTSFEEGVSFSELLREVKKTTIEGYSNQDVPFEKIVEELHVERDMSRNPLFQILFGLQNTPLAEVEFSQLNVSTIDIDAGYSRFDLAVDLREEAGGLKADFEFNTDIFSSETIARMAGHFKQLLTNIVKNPQDTLENLEMLTIEEKNTLLREWNDTCEDFSGIKNWTELFEGQVKKTPDAIAVVCGTKSLTYKELNEKADQLAQYLNYCGAGPERILGIYLDRSIEMLIGLLGVHKSGAAYLPMDPIFPMERLEYMMEDAQAMIVLTEKKLIDTLPSNNARTICLDTDWDKISSFEPEKPFVSIDEHNLAYLIYTSGSTGKPKGVQLEQKSLINFLLSMKNKTGLSEQDSLLAVTTLSFDIAGLELYMPLISGARLVIAQRDDVVDGKRLIQLLDQQNISIVQATPATWRMLIESGWEGNKNLKVLCGGEALPKELAGQLLERCSVLLNVYGPTETTIWSTLSRIESKDDDVFIGKPIANTQVYIVDKWMNPVPVGIPGELLIGGDGLARGYLNLSELTREKFIPDTLGSKQGARLYKTGDLVKYTNDGNIEFVGRIDNQVKIRGFRIELGEIESLLNQIPEIKECIITAKEIIAGEISLVAYIVSDEDKDSNAIKTEQLRKLLKDKLPDYMIPSVFILMDSFPMTPNGKVDRKALPLPESLRPQMATNYIPPSNSTEKRITMIWQEVLKLERIGMNDNFFDLGGHSLLLSQVRSKIIEILKKDISMLELFKYPTISTLSNYLTGKMETKDDYISKSRYLDKGNNTDIAVVGMSGRFPGSKNIDEFWRNLYEGVEAVSRFTDQQVLDEGIEPEMVKKKEYVKAWGAMDDIDKFDAQFFGYNPREAEVLDPQQRIFLEESWNALENAGYDAQKFKGLIGVYASVGMNTYVQNLKSSHSSKGLASDYQIMISNDKDFLATRIAYKLNLEGPCVTVQTACSSSLVAVHMACQSLKAGECDMALAGGVSIRSPQKTGYLYQEGMILSPDGHCRAFDEQAKGTVGGNGVGVVVLKRLQDAIDDGDDISAVIKGSAINNDGSQKIGYTAPSIEGQARAIAEAQMKAGIHPETISYVEAHGTGTPLGDPIEIEALNKVFANKTDKKGFCAIGSVKTNIGHLDAAAGVTGLIKTMLSMRNKKIPPSLNYKNPNPKINFKDSPFYVNVSLRDWKNSSGPLRAGISSFGIGGTNAHVVLEEAPTCKVTPDLKGYAASNLPCLLVLSAKSKKALDRKTYDFTGFLKENKDLHLADIAYTLQMGRREFEYRSFLVCTSIEDALNLLESDKSQNNISSFDVQNTNRANGQIDDMEKYTLEQLGELWLQGAKIDWGRLYKGQKRKRIALPTYPFEKQSFWVKNNSPQNILVSKDKTSEKKEISDWFYMPIWKQSIEQDGFSNKISKNEKELMLILKDNNSIADTFTHQLNNQGANIAVAIMGEEYKIIDHNNFVINPHDQSHYVKLLMDVSDGGKVPTKIVNLIGVTNDESLLSVEDRLNQGKMIFYSMMYMVQALGGRYLNSPMDLIVVTNNSQKIFNEKALFTEKALHLGACRVIPKEYPNIKCRSIDIALDKPGSKEEVYMASSLIADIFADSVQGLVAYRGMERWKQEFEKVSMDNNGNAIKLKDKGVYLITGGLGGIGLELAEYLAHRVHAKLVLAGRSEFPDEQHWNDWIATHNNKNDISKKIIKLKKLKALGAEILIHRTDITDRRQLVELSERIEQQFGTLNGIIHAAGNAGGGMIQLKKKEAAEQVLSAKTKGTITLYEVFKDSGMDFMVLCSSLNAITGGFGQIDYSAANAFLDAFAVANDSKAMRVISIDWDRWPGIGMASTTNLGQFSQREEINSFLGKCIYDSSEKIIYSKEFAADDNWALSEHFVMGTPTVAGTTYLEMAGAAFEDITGSSQFEIRDLIFLSPLSVKHGERRYVCTMLLKNGDTFDFRVISALEGIELQNSNWLEHVRGKIGPCNDTSNKMFDLDELKCKCSEQTIYSINGEDKLSEEFISFGPRWRSLKKFSIGDGQGLAEVEMRAEFNSDLIEHKLHPALLDVATGVVRLAAGGNYLPFSYEKLVVKGILPARLYGYISFKSQYDSPQEVITSDINILGDNGEVYAEIKNFSMKLTGESAAVNFKSRSWIGVHQNEYSELLGIIERSKQKQYGFLHEGITPEEGREAFGRVLEGCFRPQIIVSAKDIHATIVQADYVNQSNLADTMDEVAASKKRHPRPELDNDYVSPKNDMEKKLAKIWQDTLGIDRVGTQDEFFNLGGDSLMLIQLHTKLKENFKTEIAVVDLYKYNTIALLEKYLNSGSVADEQPVFSEVNTRVNKQLELMKQRRQQLHGRKGVLVSE
jgi:polyketide synthase PksJ